MDEAQQKALLTRVAMLEEAVFFLLRQMPKANTIETFRVEVLGSAHGDLSREKIVEDWIDNLRLRSSSLLDPS